MFRFQGQGPWTLIRWVGATPLLPHLSFCNPSSAQVEAIQEPTWKQLGGSPTGLPCVPVFCPQAPHGPAWPIPTASLQTWLPPQDKGAPLLRGLRSLLVFLPSCFSYFLFVFSSTLSIPFVEEIRVTDTVASEKKHMHFLVINSTVCSLLCCDQKF